MKEKTKLNDMKELLMTLRLMNATQKMINTQSKIKYLLKNKELSK